MRKLLAPLLLLCSTGASFDAMAQMHKCVDEGGKVTFSDRPCATPTSSAQASSAPAPMKSKDGQLSEAAVIAMVQRMVSLATQMDHSAQCAVLAPDFAFKVTDHTQSPPIVVTGGRAEMCTLLKVSADQLRASGLVPVFSASKVIVSKDATSTKATAKYDTLVKIKSVQAKAAMSQRCSQEDQLGVYSGQLMFSRTTAVCQALQ